MKRIILAALALACATAAYAQLYKQVDKDGKVTYTDQPPANADSKPLNIPSTATGTSSDPPKSALAKDKELEKGRKGAREAEKKGDEEAKRKTDNAERCAMRRTTCCEALPATTTWPAATASTPWTAATATTPSTATRATTLFLVAWATTL